MTPGGPRWPALRELHERLKAIFVESGGAMLPAHYGDPSGEVRAARTAATVYDASERSRILVTGTDGGEVLRTAAGESAAELEEGRSVRVGLLDAEGMLRDLALVSRTGGIAWLLSGEPGQRFETLARLRGAVKRGLDVRIEDRTETTCAIALGGPQAADPAGQHISASLPARLPPLHALAFEFHGFRALAVRTGPFGEDGFEFVVAPGTAAHLFETLTAAGVQPMGRTAREILRVEACVPSFDPDLLPGLSPAEADLDLAIDAPAGAERLLAALLIEAAEAVKPGTPCHADGAVAGEVRSCVRSPSLDATIGLAILESRYAFPGTPLTLDGRPAHVVAKPFVRRRGP